LRVDNFSLNEDDDDDDDDETYLHVVVKFQVDRARSMRTNLGGKVT